MGLRDQAGNTGFENVEFADGRNLPGKTYISNTNALPVVTAADALYNPGDGRALCQA